jgi:hypothetical protein
MSKQKLIEYLCFPFKSMITLQLAGMLMLKNLRVFLQPVLYPYPVLRLKFCLIIHKNKHAFKKEIIKEALKI